MAFNNKKKNANYISAKESRAIARENRKITQEIEKKRNRKHIPEEEYVTKMKNPENCVEFDNVQTYFFTDIGTVIDEQETDHREKFKFHPEFWCDGYSVYG